MTTFEYGFILKCLDFLHDILADPVLLQEAIVGYCNGDLANIRYQQHSKITDSKYWSTEDIRAATAAFSEAIAVTIKVHCHDEQALNEITTITEKLLNMYLPLITMESNPLDRLGSMQFQVAQIKTDIKKEFQTTNNAEHSYGFFALAIAVTSAAATEVTALVLK